MEKKFEKVVDVYDKREFIVPYDINDVRKRYERLYTPLVYDAMEALGMPGRAMESGIYPLIPEMKVAGPAFTVRRCSTPTRDPFIHNLRLGMMKSMIDGCVLLSDVQGNKNCGQFGEITATAMRAHGCVGAVIDGSTRDSVHLIKMNFPTFTRFRSPVEGLGRSVIVDFLIPIYVNGVDGQLLVNPGDMILADNDGVVIVPADRTIEVLELAESWFEGESATRSDMASGMNPIDVFNKYGRF